MAGDDWDVVVVGAGLAGLSAARIAAREGLACLCTDRMAPGGLLMNISHVLGYPGLPEDIAGTDLLASALESAMNAGTEIGYGEVTGLSPGPPYVLETSDGSHRARAVVVATGLADGTLGIPGEERFAGHGLSRCASCDGPLMADRDVVVAGGDEWAVREAIELAGMASRVTVVAGGDLTCTADALHILETRENARVLSGAAVAELAGDSAGLTHVIVQRGQDRETVPAAGVFVYTGRRPNTAFLGDAPAADDAGWARTDEDMRTAAPGIFACGDVRRSSGGYLVSAAADGLRAGLGAARYAADQAAGTRTTQPL